MTILNGSMTKHDGRRPEPGIDDVAQITSDSNDATALAGWIVVTIAMGLVLEAGAVRALLGTTWALPGVVCLVFIGIGMARAATLLHRASTMMKVAHDEAFRVASDGDSPLDAWRCTEALLAGAAARDTLARRALWCAYGCGAAFAVWSLAVMVLTH